MFGVFIQEGRKRRAQTQARAYPRDFSLSEKPRKIRILKREESEL
jgi:hypothetical protein